MLDLSSLPAPGSTPLGVYMAVANAINDTGVILAGGSDGHAYWYGRYFADIRLLMSCPDAQVILPLPPYPVPLGGSPTAPVSAARIFAKCCKVDPQPPNDVADAQKNTPVLACRDDDVSRRCPSSATVLPEKCNDRQGKRSVAQAGGRDSRN